MNLMQRLHSIMAPYAPPATHASSPSARVSSPANTSAFAAQLAQAAVVVTPELAATIPTTTPAKEAAALPLSASEKRDTLASLLPELPAPAAVSATEAVNGTLSPAPGSRIPDPAALAATPATTPWPTRLMQGSGASGPGINGTDAGARANLESKFGQYSDPEGQGVRLNSEGLMFRDAVAAGHVPMSPDGLETFLSWMGMGMYNADLSPSGKPAEIHSFFTSWYAAH